MVESCVGTIMAGAGCLSSKPVTTNFLKLVYPFGPFVAEIIVITWGWLEAI